MVPIFTAGELNMALGDFNFDQRNHSTCHNDKRGASLRYWSRHIFIELFHKWDLYFGNWILRLQCIETLKFYITKCQYTLSLQIWVFNEDFTTSSYIFYYLQVVTFTNVTYKYFHFRSYLSKIYIAKKCAVTILKPIIKRYRWHW